MKPDASRDEHAALISDITALMVDVRESSDLVLDPEAGPHFLGEALLSSVPRGAAEADPPAATAALDRDMAGAFRGAPGLQGRLDSLYRQQRAAQEALAHQAPGEPSEAASRAADADFALADAVDSELTGPLTARIDGAHRTTAYALAGIVGGLVLVVVGAFFATRTITRQVADIRELFARISVGEFRPAPRLQRRRAGPDGRQPQRHARPHRRPHPVPRGRDAIQEAIRKLLREISGVAEGDLTKNAEVTRTSPAPSPIPLIS